MNSVLRHLPSRFASVETWPCVDPLALPVNKRERYIRLRSAISAIVEGTPIAQVAGTHGLSQTALRTAFSRCIKVHPTDANIWGFRALVAGRRLGTMYVRATDITRSVGAGRGYCSGALGALGRRHPGLIPELIDAIQAECPGKRPSVVAAHTAFVRICHRFGVGSDQWPFCTQTLGYSTIRQFVKNLELRGGRACVARWYGDVSASHARTGTGRRGLLEAQQPLDIVMLDEVELNARFTVPIAGPAGVQYVIAERMQLIVMIDACTRFVLWWEPVFLGIKPTHLRQCLQGSLCGDRLPPLPSYLQYPPASTHVPDPGFRALRWCGWATIWMDNHASHREACFLEDLEARLGCAVNFGPPARWERRAILERRLQEILRQTGRLPSTAGDRPGDPSRASEQVVEALEITWEDLAPLISQLVAELNHLPCHGIAPLSPAEFMTQFLSTPGMHFLPHALPLPLQSNDLLLTEWHEVRVKGSIAKGRNPHVRLDDATYTSPQLSARRELIGKTLRIGVTPQDYRVLKAIVAHTGEALDVLTVTGPWARTPHSREMRKEVNRLYRNRRILSREGRDGASALSRELVERAKGRRGAASRKAASALQIHELGHDAQPSPVVLSERRCPESDSDALASALRDLLQRGRTR